MCPQTILNDLWAPHDPFGLTRNTTNNTKAFLLDREHWFSDPALGNLVVFLPLVGFIDIRSHLVSPTPEKAEQMLVSK